MKILVIGGFYDDNDEMSYLNEETIKFAKILAQEIINQGHTLINACMTEFDSVLAQSADETLKKNKDQLSDDRIIGYLGRGSKASHNYGKIRRSELKDWDLGGSNLQIPEPIDIADVLITVCGFRGTQRAANWARIAKKPILPIDKFEGASRMIYKEELINFNNSKGANISKDDFEDLSQSSISDIDLAKTVLNLSERINISKNCFVIMSFSEDPTLEDVYESFKEVCKRFTPVYDCQRMDKMTDINRITPEMFNSIRNAAFVIVDLTFERPNVYYELGYADALDKPIIVTAREGTNVHFDAKDFPILFWKSQTNLKKELTLRIEQIAKKQGRVKNQVQN
jgi:hypothetical protein